MAEPVNPLAGLTVPQLKAQAIEAKPGLGEFLTDIGEGIANSANRTASSVYGGLGSAASWLGAPGAGAALFGLQQESQDKLARRVMNEAAREQGYNAAQAAINAELSRRQPSMRVASATPVSDYRSSLAQRAQAAQGVSRMRQQTADRNQFMNALAASFASMPRAQFTDYLRSQPAPPKAPSAEDDLLRLLMADIEKNAALMAQDPNRYSAEDIAGYLMSERTKLRTRDPYYQPIEENQ